MSEQRYMISDASKKLDVEPHVLRYWEEELEMDISRNEMGHRYYMEHDLRILRSVKELKQQGFQLKAIKLLLPELKASDGNNLDKLLGLKEELNKKVEEEEGGILLASRGQNKSHAARSKSDIHIVEQSDTRSSALTASETMEVTTDMDDKMNQFQSIMNKIIANALVENNAILGQTIGDNVSNQVIKEMDYLMKIKDDREEQRFKRLDETIREYQKARQEAAVSLEPRKPAKRRKSRFFRRKPRR